MVKIVPVILGITISLILVGGLLMPIVNDAVDSSATPIDFENTNNSASPYKYDYVDRMDLEIDVTSDDVTITVNGMTLEPSTANYVLFASSNGFSEVFPESSGNVTRLFYWADELDGTDSYTVSRSEIGVTTVIIENGSYTITTYDGNTIESISSWVACPINNGSFIAHHGNFNSCYFTSIDEMIVYSGNYTSGENDSFISYGQGELTTSDAWDGLVSVDYVGGSIVDGTSNVYYGGNVVITVDDETFTPYRTLIKQNVVGLSDENSAQKLFLVIPAIVIIAIIIMGVSLVRRY